MAGVLFKVRSFPRILACALAVALPFACSVEDDDVASSSDSTESSDGPLDDWQGIWVFDWQVTGGGCPSLFTSDTRFVKVRWISSGQLMFIYDEDWDDAFDDTAYLVGSPGSDSVTLVGDYVSGEQQYHVNGTLTQMGVDYLAGTFYRDIVGVCTEMQAIEAFRISYQASMFEDTPERARLLFRDDLGGSLDSVSIRAELLSDRTMFVDTSVGKRVLVDVPAGRIKVSAAGNRGLPLELREGEIREVYLSSLVTDH